MILFGTAYPMGCCGIPHLFTDTWKERVNRCVSGEPCLSTYRFAAVVNLLPTMYVGSFVVCTSKNVMLKEDKGTLPSGQGVVAAPSSVVARMFVYGLPDCCKRTMRIIVYTACPWLVDTGEKVCLAGVDTTFTLCSHAVATSQHPSLPPLCLKAFKRFNTSVPPPLFRRRVWVGWVAALRISHPLGGRCYTRGRPYRLLARLLVTCAVRRS